MLLDYQRRVLDEKDELDKKIRELSTYLNSYDYHTYRLHTSEVESRMMLIQIHAMSAYSEILHQRINTWEDPF